MLPLNIILFAKRSTLNVWQCSEYVCLDNSSVICAVTLRYVLHQTRSEFWHSQNSIYYQVHSIIFSIIKAYSGILKYFEPFKLGALILLICLTILWSWRLKGYCILRLIQAYSAHCVTLTYSQLCHIPRRSIQNWKHIQQASLSGRSTTLD